MGRSARRPRSTETLAPDGLYALFGFSELNPNIARGWMSDRVMDVLEQNPGSGHDPQKLAVTGCSGCGKGSLLTGVFSRVPLTVIVVRMGRLRGVDADAAKSAWSALGVPERMGSPHLRRSALVVLCLGLSLSETYRETEHWLMRLAPATRSPALDDALHQSA